MIQEQTPRNSGFIPTAIAALGYYRWNTLLFVLINTIGTHFLLDTKHTETITGHREEEDYLIYITKRLIICPVSAPPDTAAAESHKKKLRASGISFFETLSHIARRSGSYVHVCLFVFLCVCVFVCLCVRVYVQLHAWMQRARMH